jgi:membrane associated rhomboid family serine protease
MIAFIPVGHDQQSLRSIPYATIAIFLICCVVLAATQGAIEREESEYEQIAQRLDGLKVAVYMRDHGKKRGGTIAAMIDPEASNYFEVHKKLGENIEAHWGRFTKSEPEQPDDLYQTYLELQAAQERLRDTGIIGRFGLVPARLSLHSFITAMFMHASLGHLLMNMLFLYLVAFALEDVWGKVAFVAVYLASGIAASLAHIAFNPGSEVAAIGASGAIAGLMGAFLVRFFRAKIDFAYYYFLMKLHYGRFSVPAFVALPIWLAGQLLYASLSAGDVAGVAFWAHIGGFGFGAVVAFGLSAVGIGTESIGELSARDLEEMKRTPVTDLQHGRDLANQGRMSEAKEHFDTVLQTKPTNIPARLERIRVDLAGENPSAVAQEAADLIRVLVQAENLPQAEQLLNEAAVLPGFDPEPTAVMRIAGYLEKNWKNEKSARWFEWVAQRPGPWMGKALLSLGRLYSVRMRDKDRGRAVYERALEELDQDDPARIAASEALDALGISEPEMKEP